MAWNNAGIEPDPLERVDWLLTEVTDQLTDWEYMFLDGLAHHRPENMTPQQLGKIDEIFEKYEPIWHEDNKPRWK